MNDTALIDCGYKGYNFTWSNNREESELVKERLDKALCTKRERTICPKTQVVNESPIGSDRVPLVVYISWNEIKGKWKF